VSNTQQERYLSSPVSSSSPQKMTDSSFSPESDSECSSIEGSLSKKTYLASRRTHAIQDMKSDSRYYTGVPQGSWKILETLERHSGVKLLHILIILRKLRRNEPLKTLANTFELTEGQISKIITLKIQILAEYMAQYIFFPTNAAIRANLPSNFLMRYKNVRSLIDGFEIKIEKFSNAVNQSLTWSDYKSSNTIKYLISCTPDGFINFISKGYGGRTSDKEITRISGYLDVLPENSRVMADRGFKHITNMLLEKKCELVRPPSVEAKKKPTKREAKLGKQIASLRTNVERVIGRLRDFGIISGLSLDHHYVEFLDAILVIICGISNWQDTIG
jgi:hypothetical protein